MLDSVYECYENILTAVRQVSTCLLITTLGVALHNPANVWVYSYHILALSFFLRYLIFDTEEPEELECQEIRPKRRWYRPRIKQTDSGNNYRNQNNFGQRIEIVSAASNQTNHTIHEDENAQPHKKKFKPRNQHQNQYCYKNNGNHKYEGAGTKSDDYNYRIVALSVIVFILSCIVVYLYFGREISEIYSI